MSFLECREVMNVPAKKAGKYDSGILFLFAVEALTDLKKGEKKNQFHSHVKVCRVSPLFYQNVHTETTTGLH